MTIFAATLDHRHGVATTVAEVPPPPDAFVDLVNDLTPAGFWRLSDTSTTAFTDLTGRAPGAWVLGLPLVQRPTLFDNNSDGFSTDLYGQARGLIPHHASHITASGGVFIACQFRDAVPKQAIVNRFDGPVTDGRWLLELTANGQITGKLVAGGLTISISSSTGVVVKGVPVGIALTWGAGGLRLYVNSATPVATNATTAGAAGMRTIAVGDWYSGGGWLSGLIENLVLFSAQPIDAAIAALMAEVKTTGITHANSDATTAVAGQSVVDVDVLANDHYQGAKATAAIVITAQGSLGTYAVEDDNNIAYTAGATGGTDTAGRYTVNGSPPAILTALVTPPPVGASWTPTSKRAMPTGHGTWDVFRGHDTGEITQAIINANQNDPFPAGVFPWRRYAIVTFDGLPALRERLTISDTVSTIGYRATHTSFNLTPYRYILFRFHFYATDYWGCEGKYHMLTIGRGWGANQYRQTGAQYGDTGTMCNAMHPEIGTTNENFLRSFHMKYKATAPIDGYGYAAPLMQTEAALRYIPNQWHTIDMICDTGTPNTSAKWTNNTGAWRLYLNGVLAGEETGINVLREPTLTALGASWEVRDMSGGDPESLIGQNKALDNYYAGFFLARSTGDPLLDPFLYPFDPASVQYRPVPNPATYASDVHASTIALGQHVGNGSINGLNSNQYGVALTRGTASDPQRTITATPGFGNIGLPHTIRVPNSFPFYGQVTNGEAAIILDDSGIAHEYHGYESTGLRAQLRREFPVSGSGHSTTLGDRVGVSGSGISCWIGAVRKFEIETPGLAINHVHAIAVPRLPAPTHPAPMLLGKGIQWPCTAGDGNANSASNNLGPIPYGGLIALPRTLTDVDITAIINAVAGVSAAAREAAIRLYISFREYGIYVIDGGTMNFRGDLPSALTADLHTIIRATLWQRLRLVTNNVTGATAVINANGTYSGSIGTPTVDDASSLIWDADDLNYNSDSLLWS